MAPIPRARARGARRWRRELGGGVRQHPGSNNCVEEGVRGDRSCGRRGAGELGGHRQPAASKDRRFNRVHLFRCSFSRARARPRDRATNLHGRASSKNGPPVRRRARPVSSVIWAWHANPWMPLRSRSWVRIGRSSAATLRCPSLTTKPLSSREAVSSGIRAREARRFATRRGTGRARLSPANRKT